MKLAHVSDLHVTHFPLSGAFALKRLAAIASYTLMGRKDLAVTSLADLIAKAKAQPRSFTYASAGNGSGQHVLAAALWHQADVELVHVPYRGAQAAYQDLLGGRVDVFFDLAPTARGQINGGTVKGLATSGAAVISAYLTSRWRVAYWPEVAAVYRESPGSILRSGVASKIDYLRSALRFDSDARAYFATRTDYPHSFRWEVAVGMLLWVIKGRDRAAAKDALSDLRAHFGLIGFLRAGSRSLALRLPRARRKPPAPLREAGSPTGRG